MQTSQTFCGGMLRGVPSARNLPMRGPEVDEHGEAGAAGDGMHHAGGVGVVIAEQLHHPAGRMPAPGGVDDPGDGAQHDRDDPERARFHALDDRARDDRGGRPGEQQEAAQNTPLRRAHRAVSAGVRLVLTGLPPMWAPISSFQGSAKWRRDEAAGDAGAVHHGRIEPPAEQIEADADGRDDHRVLQQRGEVVLASRDARPHRCRSRHGSGTS